MQVKRIKRAVNGVLLLDKPIGYSSNQALQKVKWLYQAAKAGHTGTLDPLATGVLPICLGEATKFAQYLTDENKTYLASIKFGVTTTTGDAEGEVITEQTCDVRKADILRVLPHFLGEITQVPPMYSALKVDGKPLYEYARAGVELDRKARIVVIHAIDVAAVEGNIAKVEVTCSKGTYIRTLAEDIGKALNVGAHLVGLRRTATASYDIEHTYSIEALEAMSLEQRDACLQAVDSAIVSLDKVTLNEDASFYFKQGQAVWVPKVTVQGELRVFNQDDTFIGLGYVMEDGRVAPKRLVHL